ncbi:MAG: archaetidylserine decarboxylase [Deltaproteobacteria bacterium]|nr:archaetidylserine decarboxylase [Deltaproteobacteria bacterium]
MNGRLALTLLKVLPRNALSRAVGGAVRGPWPRAMHRLSIRTFVKLYGIETGEIARDPADFPTFGEFFIRELQPGAREIEGGPGTPVSPCDGTVGAFGRIEDGQLIQAKGRTYPLDRFLGGEGREVPFLEGHFLTIYLSPRNYHRVHAPLAGRISEAVHVPGTLWPVFPAAVDTLDELFVANERLLTFLESDRGAVCVAMVGATCVGRMRASFDEIVTNVPGPPVARRYDDGRALERGAELGIFEMGSTVVLLLSKEHGALDPGLAPGQPIRLGQRIGSPAS